MIILPLTYWGSIEHFAQLRQGGEEAVIDLGENYVKRSERNRTEIVTPTGGMVLSVPLIKANRPRTPMRDMRIDNSKRWQHQHWVAILSAYRSSPYFDYIADRIAPIYEREWGYLIDLNREILQAEFDILGIEPKHRFSEQYIEPSKKREPLRLSPILSAIYGSHPLCRECVDARSADVRGREAIALLDSCQL